MTRFATLFSACASVAMIAIPIQAQETNLPATVEVIDTEAEETSPVELTHGMPRLRVLQLLGEPPLESRIGVLNRSRATLSNGTELLFEQDALIAVNSPLPPEPTDDGRLSIVVDRKTVIYDDVLVLPKPMTLPAGDERLSIDENFYFAAGVDGQDGYDVHFTPATRECVLNDCPGCNLCGDGSGTLYQSHWDLFKFSADAVFLSRLGSDFALPLLDGGTAIQAEDLTHGLTAGIRSTLALHLYDGQHVEFGYLGSFDWSADGSSSNLIDPTGGVLSWNGTYDAQLNDYQINYRHRTWDSNWSVMCGVRYSEHEDHFTAAFDGVIAGPPIVNRNPLNIRGHARNRLLGIHVGTAAEWNCGPFLLFASMKGGAFNNETEQFGPRYTGAIDLGTNPASLPTFARDGQEISFMGDFEFTVSYPIMDGALIRVGYQGLIFSDMVQVRKQMGTAASGAPLHYHGIFAGFEFRQ